MQLCFESVLKYHVFFPASNEANFRARKLQNKGTLTLNLPREYRTDLNLNNQEFRADNRLLLSPCRTLLNTCRSCQEVFGYKYHLVSTITHLLQEKTDYAEMSTMGLTTYREKERTVNQRFQLSHIQSVFSLINVRLIINIILFQ